MAASLDWTHLIENRKLVQTRRALVLIDLQNDFLSQSGELQMTIAPGYIKRLEKLVSTFRKFDGRVIWVRTEFEPEEDNEREASRDRRISAANLDKVMGNINVVSKIGVSEPPTPIELPPSQPTIGAVRPLVTKKKSMSRIKARSLLDKISGRKKQLLSTLTVNAETQPGTANPDATEPLPSPAETNSDQESNPDLNLSEMRRAIPICVRDTWGAKLVAPLAELYDFRTDIEVVKSHDCAFRDTNLLSILRMQMVTQLYICGCGTNTSISDTVAVASQHAFGTIVIEDCLAYRFSHRHAEAITYMSQEMGSLIRRSSDVVSSMYEADAERDSPGGAENSKTKVEQTLPLQSKTILRPSLDRLDMAIEDEMDDMTAALEVTSLGGPGLEAGSVSDQEDVDEMEHVRPSVAYASSRGGPRVPTRSQDTMSREAAVELKHQSAKGEGKQAFVQNLSQHLRDQAVYASQVEQLRAEQKIEASRKPILDVRATSGPHASSDDSSRMHRAHQQATVSQGPTTTQSIAKRNSITEEQHPQLKATQSSRSPPFSTRPAQTDVKAMVDKQPQLSPNLGADMLDPSVETKEETKAKKKKKKSKKAKSKLNTDRSIIDLDGLDIIGEGDCRLIDPFLGDGPDRHTALGPVRETAFGYLQHGVGWQTMHHQEGEVPRLVAVQGEIDSVDGSYPVYRHPSDQSPPLRPFGGIVSIIRQDAERAVGHKLNHVLIQLYRNGEDNISEHSDKTLDIVHGSSIVNVSFGAQRTMRLRTKRPLADATDPSSSSPAAPNIDRSSTEEGTSRTTQRIPMPNNSLFVLGPKTNASWLHSIQPDKRRPEERLPAELAYSGQRISLTFRHIGTFLTADPNATNNSHGNQSAGKSKEKGAQRIWGQGAKAKTKDQARAVVNGDEVESRKLIEAFSRENRESFAKWEEWYGEGSDVLHFKMEGVKN